MKKEIKEFRGEFAFLSNFYNSPFVYDGCEFDSVEHAYQAYKAEDKKMFHKIRLARTASDAKRMGRRIRIRDDWDAIKVSLMEDLVMQKFSQNANLRDKLIATGEAELREENTWGDRFWGVDGTGDNVLGKILMQVRNKLKEHCAVI